MPAVLDDKSEHCVPFILDRIKQHLDSAHSEGHTASPFFIGLNGVQGAGKTTLVGISLFQAVISIVFGCSRASCIRESFI